MPKRSKVDSGTLVILGLGGLLLAGIASHAARAKAVKVDRVEASPGDVTAVLDVFEKYGWPRREADIVIGWESEWNPHNVNPITHAVGLIQFTPDTLRGLGWNQGWEAFSHLSPQEQIPWIEAFLQGLPRKWKVPGDTYLAIFNPAHVGDPDSTVLYATGSKGAKQNKQLQAPDGSITAGSVRAKVTSNL